MAATIRDITRITGLSVATVSKYLNGGNVLPENRRRIEEAIRSLHYEVNEIARGLATSRTKTVGILIPNLDNIFAASIIANVEDLLREHGYGSIVCGCKGDPAVEEKELAFLLSKRVDGIVTIPSSGSADYLKKASSRGVPVVLVDRAFDSCGFDSVLADNAGASHMAVSTLIERGHRRIGIICAGDESYTARKRLRGYAEALWQHKLPYEENLVQIGDLSVQHGYNGLKALCSLPDPPTAVYFTNYDITLGGIVAMNELGLHFPADISVVGFDNLMLSQVVNPRLWMIVQPMEDIAQTAARTILGRLDGTLRSPTLTYKLKTTLLEGESIRRL